MAPKLHFRLLPGRWAVCRLAPDAPIPQWALPGTLTSITRTPEELSIVCPQENVPEGVMAGIGWACLQLIGPFAFSLSGILAAFIQPLAAAQVPIFALSTFDTDWVLIPVDKLDPALRALEAAGHNKD